MSVTVADFFEVLVVASQVDSYWEALWSPVVVLIPHIIVILMRIFSLQEGSSLAKIDDYYKSNLLFLSGTIEGAESCLFDHPHDLLLQLTQR